MQIREFLENVCEQIKYKPIRNEISEELGISRSYVSRIEKRALLKIYKKFLKNKKEY